MTSTLTAEERRDARIATDAPRVPWDEFRERFQWERGEHVGLIGPTGQGKTSLLRAILPMHPYTTVFATKPEDESLELFERVDGYQRIESWRSEDPRIHPRRLLWPDAKRLGAQKHQAEVFGDAMDRIFREGKWTVAVDELMYLVNRLKLRAEVQDFFTQTRSMRLSFAACTQRPAWVPTEMYDQSTHLFMWRNNDARALQRLAEINVRDRELVRHVVVNLEQYQTLYINTRTGEMCRTRAPRPRGEATSR